MCRLKKVIALNYYLLLLVLILSVKNIHAQQAFVEDIYANDSQVNTKQTLFSKLSSISPYFALQSSLASFKKNPNFSLYARAGIILNQKIGIGLIGNIGQGANNSKDDGVNLNSTDFNVNYYLGGGNIEYILNTESTLHPSFFLNIMGGKTISSPTQNSNSKLDSAYTVVLEPGINFEFNITNNFQISFYVSYRKMFLSRPLKDISNYDLSGVNIGTIIKISN